MKMIEHGEKLHVFCNDVEAITLKNIGGRLDRKTKSYWFNLEKRNVQHIAAFFPHIEIDSGVHTALRQVSSVLRYAKKVKDEFFPIPYPDKYLNYPFYDHQAKSFNFFKELRSSIDFSEPGAGKTMVQIALIKWRWEKFGIRKVLIICPKSLIINVWEKDIKDFLYTIKEGYTKYPIIPLTMTCAKCDEIIRDKQNGIFIINYEKVWRLKEIFNKEWDFIILDESTKIKTVGSKQTKAVHKLNAKFKTIMTGTPAPNSYLELWPQLNFINSKLLGQNYYSFRSTFFDQSPYTEYTYIPKTKALIDIKQRIEMVAVAWKKKDCLDLPPVVYQTLRVPLEGDQKRAYKEMFEDMIAELDDEEYRATIALTKIMRLSQITSGFIQNTDGEDFKEFKKNPKFEMLKELCYDIIPTESKIIIWAIFKKDIERMIEHFGDRALSYYGDTKPKERKDAVKKFQNDKKYRYFIAHPKSAGHGLTLTAANYAIYYSMDHSYEAYQQSVDRINRISQLQKMTVYFLQGKGTTDVAIYNAVMGKKTVNEFLTDIKKGAE